MEGSQAETKEVAEEEHGEFKMSEESFPDGRMNRKWLSDVLDKLVEEANVSFHAAVCPPFFFFFF